jgi:hypothetical protein
MIMFVENSDNGVNRDWCANVAFQKDLMVRAFMTSG